MNRGVGWPAPWPGITAFRTPHAPGAITAIYSDKPSRRE